MYISPAICLVLLFVMIYDKWKLVDMVATCALRISRRKRSRFAGSNSNFSIGYI